MVTKLSKMSRFLPSRFRPTVNPNIRGILYAWAGEDDLLVQAIEDAKEQLYVVTAQLQYLDALGSNIGVFRPTVFNLSDSLFRQLIPALSFSPKQVIPTIKKVLDVFFGVGNLQVLVHEIRPNEIEIQIPSSVPSLTRGLRGSHHFHNYSGEITNVDNILKEITIDLDGDTKQLVIDEIAGGIFGQDINSKIILSHTAGDNGVVIQFSVSDDLSGFSVGRFSATHPVYIGSFLPDKTALFSTTRQRGVLGQTITAGAIVPNLIMTEASGIPDAPGYVVFNVGNPNEESLVKYLGRPNNTTILIDPSYTFTKDHSSGEVVNVIVKPYQAPNQDGSDYSVFLVGIIAARLLAQQIIQSIVAAGVVINWTIVEPEIIC